MVACVYNQFPRAEDVLSMLLRTKHNSFPVLYPGDVIELNPELGNFAGIITRKHLCILLSKRALTPRRPDLPSVNQLAGTGYASGSFFGASAHAHQRRRHTPEATLRSRVMSFTDHIGAPPLTYDDIYASYPRFPSADSISRTLRPED